MSKLATINSETTHFVATKCGFVYTDAVSNRNGSGAGNRIENDTSRASQFRARPFLNRCGFAVYTTNETVSFWKRYTFDSVFKTNQFW